MGAVTVNIQFLDAVTWLNETECTFQLNDEVDLWRVNISANQSNIANLLSLLQPDEIVRANRYLQEKDRTRFIVSRAALRQILGKYTNQSAVDLKFSIGTNKKPYISGTDIRYNVSHSADWVLIAIANTNVGVDTEKINPLFDFTSILEDNFSKAEIDFIGQSPQNFFLLWTRKEALTKATSQGLDENLKYMPSLDGLHPVDARMLLTDRNWQVKSFKIDGLNWGSVALESKIQKLNFFDHI
ncbi:4'-phosphopantetheinyl transferase superfamily protein [Mucilaginibacter sp.]|uniref:4'-phosphopantetheinyl transferase family protein n=1 Tax=Mucilaginibacter sp. TaxID=1882438 RepID=UPI0025DB5DBB|nr:4'-phosphopantetheinyl transferase superfamily protein [Mucilaginibacter sp.]